MTSYNNNITMIETFIWLSIEYISTFFKTNEAGIGSRSHVLVLGGARIFSTSSSDTCVKEDTVFVIGLGLITSMDDAPGEFSPLGYSCKQSSS